MALGKLNVNHNVEGQVGTTAGQLEYLGEEHREGCQGLGGILADFDKGKDEGEEVEADIGAFPPGCLTV